MMLIVSNIKAIQIVSISTHCELGKPIKEISMLTTIMITLLCIWLAIMILGQVIGGVIGYKMFKAFTSEERTK
jgi:ABC-type siderophore export system fused ATPase/permease subunit